MRVWIIEGWFGDIEWIESVYADQDKAEARVTELWKNRKSDQPVPDYIQGLCKFAAVDHEVIQ